MINVVQRSLTNYVVRIVCLHSSPHLWRLTESVQVVDKPIPGSFSQNRRLDPRSNTHSINKVVHLGNSSVHSSALDLRDSRTVQKTSLHVPANVLLDGKDFVNVAQDLVNTLVDSGVVRHAVTNGLNKVLGARKDVVRELLATVAVLFRQSTALLENALLICNSYLSVDISILYENTYGGQGASWGSLWREHRNGRGGARRRDLEHTVQSNVECS